MKTNAWILPINSENAIQIISSGIANGNVHHPVLVTMLAINESNTSPAKMLPYRRKPNVITFVNSSINLIGNNPAGVKKNFNVAA